MIEDFHSIPPYSLKSEDKERVFFPELAALTRFHMEHCTEYRHILEALGTDPGSWSRTSDLPFLPIRLFKEMDLLSIPRDRVFKIMTSSGTTGQAVSKIFLDRDNALLQQKVMLRLLCDFIGKKRQPLLVVDSPDVLKNRQMFSARGAAIIGLQAAASEFKFALNPDMTLNVPLVEDFLSRHGESPFLIFGFTFMLWRHLFQQRNLLNGKYSLPHAFLLSSGGWKKLESEKISRENFKQFFADAFGIRHFLDHYAMVEQTGCLYAECEYGHLHASIYSDFIPRRVRDFSPCGVGEPGIVQVLSVLPHSYPGHSLLTEDEGRILGVDDCPCGRNGKYIQVLGRIKQAELRGCSDTYAAAF